MYVCACPVVCIQLIINFVSILLVCQGSVFHRSLQRWPLHSAPGRRSRGRHRLRIYKPRGDPGRNSGTSSTAATASSSMCEGGCSLRHGNRAVSLLTSDLKAIKPSDLNSAEAKDLLERRDLEDILYSWDCCPPYIYYFFIITVRTVLTYIHNTTWRIFSSCYCSRKDNRFR